MTEVQRSASGGGVGSSDFCFRAVSAPGQVRARARNNHERAPPPPKRKPAETGMTSAPSAEAEASGGGVRCAPGFPPARERRRGRGNDRGATGMTEVLRK